MMSGEALDYDFLADAYAFQNEGFDQLWARDEDRVDYESHGHDVPCRPIVTTIENV